MSTFEYETKSAVVFTEGERLRAVATWRRDARITMGEEGNKWSLSNLESIELEIRGSSAMGEPRWESCGRVPLHADNGGTKWIACFLIACAERWQKENL